MLTITSCIIALTNCVNNQAEKIVIVNPSGQQFAGSSVCQNCHRELYDSFVRTPHYLTSQPASKKYIKGSFDKGKNVYNYNYFDKVILEDKDSGLFQVE